MILCLHPRAVNHPAFRATQLLSIGDKEEPVEGVEDTAVRLRRVVSPNSFDHTRNELLALGIGRQTLEKGSHTGAAHHFHDHLVRLHFMQVGGLPHAYAAGPTGNDIRVYGLRFLENPEKQGKRLFCNQ